MTSRYFEDLNVNAEVLFHISTANCDGFPARYACKVSGELMIGTSLPRIRRSMSSLSGLGLRASRAPMS